MQLKTVTLSLANAWNVFTTLGMVHLRDVNSVLLDFLEMLLIIQNLSV